MAINARCRCRFFFRNDEHFIILFRSNLKVARQMKRNERWRSGICCLLVTVNKFWPVFSSRFQLNVFIRLSFLHLLLNFFICVFFYICIKSQFKYLYLVLKRGYGACDCHSVIQGASTSSYYFSRLSRFRI